MVAESTSIDTDLEAAYSALEAIVANSDAPEHRIYAATLKTQLMRELGTFSEKSLGFARFIQFLQSAAAAGRIQIARDDHGHPYVQAPGDPRDGGHVAIGVDGFRIKPDLWASFVDWEEPCARYWDTKSRRALTVPLAADGSPLWTTDAERFVEIPPVTKSTHLSWMRSFADETSDTATSGALLAALSQPASAGAYKRVLQRHGLESEWTSFLRAKVASHATAWATTCGVSPHTFLMRSRTAMTAPAQVTNGGDTSAPRARVRARGDRTSESDAQLLRSRLHEVIDRMSLSELAALRVPASYLIND